MATQPEHRCSAAEYLTLERVSDVKSEYLNGLSYGMGGETARHVQIVGNTIRELGNQLLERACTVYSTDRRVVLIPVDLCISRRYGDMRRAGVP
jgi:hypothetical protein